jgi:hypothetical protein
MRTWGVDTRTSLVRARHLQAWLEFVEAMEAPYPERFRQHLAAETNKLIREAAPVAWLPARLHAELAEVGLAAFGVRRAHEYYRWQFGLSMQGPLLGPLLRTGVAVFGLSPAAFLRWANRGWDLSFRDAGGIHGEVLENGHGRLFYRDMPQALATSHAWVESVASSFYGMLDFTRTTGVVRFIERDPAAGNFTLELEWA